MTDLFIVDRIYQRPNLLNLHANVIPMVQHHLWITHGANSRPCASHNDGSLLQRCSLGKERYDLGNSENHLPISMQLLALGNI